MFDWAQHLGDPYGENKLFNWAQHLGDPYGENNRYVLLTLRHKTILSLWTLLHAIKLY